MSSAPVTDGLRLVHKRWGEALPHSVPPQPCYRSHMHSDTGLAMCRVRMQSTGAILLHAPGRAFTACGKSRPLPVSPPVRPSALLPKPGRSGMPSSTRHTQYEATQRTGDKEHKKDSVAPDLIRGLLAKNQLHSDREWTPDQVRGYGREKCCWTTFTTTHTAIVLLRLDRRINRTIQRCRLPAQAPHGSHPSGQAGGLKGYQARGWRYGEDVQATH